MNTLPKIFIISLTHSLDRRKNVSDRLTELKIPFVFFDAIDGNNLVKEDWLNVDSERIKKNFGVYLSKGEIGCALSHIKIYEKCVSEDINEALILEDDISIPDCFYSTLLDFQAKKKDSCEIAFLYHGKCKTSWFYTTLFGNYKLKKLNTPSRNSRRFITGTVAYWINRKGMQKLLDICYPIRMPADYLTGLIQKNNLNCYIIEPNLIELANFKSTISRDAESKEIAGKENKKHIN